jgi:L-threonylcarbamoyladenylate synthase
MANSRIVAADAQGLQAAAELIRHDDVCAFPTETVYGLGANAFSDQAVQRIYDLKRRPAGNPLIVHISRVQDAHKISDGWSDVAEKLAGEFWPGPMTLVVRRADAVSSLVSAGGPSVAIRVPAHPIARQLLDLC